MAAQGYARCSTDERRQDTDRQRRNLLTPGAEGETETHWDDQSGAKSGRLECQRLLTLLQPRDKLIAAKASRLTRSTQQLCEVPQIVQIDTGAFRSTC